MGFEPSKLGMELVDWWHRNRRSYPWRKTSDPYRILIAEIMLQRTKADQVAPVYREFVERYPTIFLLGKASMNDLNGFFSRLGLLWRASAIMKMANFLVREYGGKLPRSREELLKIPAIGEYIADALLSFAFRQRAVVVDSNVCRILARVYDLPIKYEANGRRKVRDIATAMLSSRLSSRSLNFALLDFAALMCKARNPLCSKCPFISRCGYGLKHRDAQVERSRNCCQ